MSELTYQSANKKTENKSQSGLANSNKSVLQDNREQTMQHKILTDTRPATVQRNNTGMPDKLKTGIENLSGMNMDHVKVHYNSAKPAQLNAHAYAQGSQIHLAPGQEKHLPHEAWHVVQQAQGRVKPTMQMKAGVPVNDDAGLEKEADVMGARAQTTSHSIQLDAMSAATTNYSYQAVQLHSQIIEQQDQAYTYGHGQSINVGSVMAVGLDPTDMKQGQSANLNTSQDEMMSAIRYKWGIHGGDLVKGHLWNDNLGGSAMNYNLYPITKAANSDHLGYVENKAKEFIWINKKPIYYKVEVDATPNIHNATAEFDCEIRDWDPNTGNIGGLLFGPITIASDLNNVGAYNEAYETYTGNVADRQKRPKKPKWASAPKTRVGALTKQEAWDRQNQ